MQPIKQVLSLAMFLLACSPALAQVATDEVALRQLATGWEQAFRESTWSTKAVKVQFLKPDVALVHVDWTIQGDKDPDGTPRSPRSGVFMWVVVKQSGGWLIRAAQNTNQGNLATPPAAAK